MTATSEAIVEATEGPAFTRSFPMLPFAIRHRLVDNPLFSLARVADLVREMPRDRIEFNSGKAAIGQDPNTVPMVDLDPQEIVRQIKTCDAWMVLKRVESQPTYRAVLEDVLLSVARANGHRTLTEAGFEDIRGFLFVSSPNATTPFHIDGEDNFFVHIHGEKYFTVCDNRDGSIASDDEVERALCEHRNVSYRDGHASKSRCFSLNPGDGLFVPYCWPHWVRTGSQYSISLAITWRTKAVTRKNDIFVVNSMLRRFGFPQAAPGKRPAFDAVKFVLFRAVKMIADPLRKSESLRAILRVAIYGRNANYFLRDKAKSAG